MWQQLIWVGLGGALGSMARYSSHWLIGSRSFPWGTLAVNVIGSLLIGWILGHFGSRWELNHPARLFFVTGICGGFTTFSAFTQENLSLLQEGKYSTAMLYVAASLTFGLLAVALGWWIAQANK